MVFPSLQLATRPVFDKKIFSLKFLKALKQVVEKNVYVQNVLQLFLLEIYFCNINLWLARTFFEYIKSFKEFPFPEDYFSTFNPIEDLQLFAIRIDFIIQLNFVQ